NGGADSRAEALRESILSAESGIQTGRKFYYVSSQGDDANDGTSPEKPIQSLTRIGTLPLRSGDRVLFRRGDMFRAEYPLGLRGGVWYGAYGEGKKPLICGSVRDYADESIWTCKEGDLWILSLPYEQAGMINFNGDHEIGFRKQTLELVEKHGDYYHDVENGVLYLNCAYGNPGAHYEEIEIATTDDILLAQNVNDVRVDNLCLKYASKFGIDFGNNKEIVVSNCEIAWIGGAIYRGDIRYGNGVQFWYRADDVCVEHCLFYQIFDAAVTYQGFGTDKPIFRNIVFKDNLIENCSMNIECWAGTGDGNGPEPILRNIEVKENIVRFGAYGWGGLQRPDLGDQALFMAWDRHYKDNENLSITDNVFDCGDCSLIWSLPPEKQEGLFVRGNSYYQRPYTGRNPYTEVVRTTDLHAHDQASLERAVAYFDKEPKEVRWIEL
ncbi:MAG: hypothetical protein UHS49_06990, partial [Faecalimonas sp.]|nr:hypothetical protein [Faecalimonas sp.]